MESTDIRQYFLSYTGVLKIAKYRGYSVPDERFMNIEEFTVKYAKYDDSNKLKEEMSGIIFEKEPPQKTPSDNQKGDVNAKIIVEWYSDKRIGIGIRDIVTKMEKEGIKNALVVVDNNLTAGCRDMIKNIKSTLHIIIDVWTLKESMIFVPDHVFVPKHRICSIQESKAICKAYGIKPNKNIKIDMLPHIKCDDVMVKYLGAKKGQLIEITRASDTNPKLEIITYRLVV